MTELFIWYILLKKNKCKLFRTSRHRSPWKWERCKARHESGIKTKGFFSFMQTKRGLHMLRRQNWWWRKRLVSLWCGNVTLSAHDARVHCTCTKRSHGFLNRVQTLHDAMKRQMQTTPSKESDRSRFLLHLIPLVHICSLLPIRAACTHQWESRSVTCDPSLLVWS